VAIFHTQKPTENKGICPDFGIRSTECIGVPVQTEGMADSTKVGDKYID
jgi:hypothetical protein